MSKTVLFQTIQFIICTEFFSPYLVLPLPAKGHSLGVLFLCREAVGVFPGSSRRGNSDSMVIFWGKRRMQLLDIFSLIMCLYTALHNRRSVSSNVIVFYTSAGILSRSVAFCFYFFFQYRIKFFTFLLSSSWLTAFSFTLPATNRDARLIWV